MSEEVPKKCSVCNACAECKGFKAFTTIEETADKIIHIHNSTQDAYAGHLMYQEAMKAKGEMITLRRELKAAGVEF